MGRQATDEIAAILKEGKDLTLATLMPDGAPQATTVSYASDGLTIYFGCGAASRKAQNLAGDPRVAVTVNLPYADWMQIRGLALSGRAERVTGAEEIAHGSLLFLEKFPEVAQYTEEGDLSGPDHNIIFFRIRPEIVSILDYRKGFGHTELVRLDPARKAA
jgi:nitroimidazol reductase NimA-like FMN-containing flavoprotein (pyridoxamine 5'-phosphate oxidase superfamily)